LEAVLTLGQVADLLGSSHRGFLDDGGSKDSLAGRTGVIVEISWSGDDSGSARKDPNEAFEPECVLPLPLNLHLSDWRTNRVYHLGYITKIELGTPQRSFNVIVDSGSADFWVGHEYCENSDDGGVCVRLLLSILLHLFLRAAFIYIISLFLTTSNRATTPF
jgi:hypothetical protein